MRSKKVILAKNNLSDKEQYRINRIKDLIEYERNSGHLDLLTKLVPYLEHLKRFHDFTEE